MPTLFQISVEVNSGSVGKIAEAIGESAISAGWNSYITYARGYQPSKSHVIKIGHALDIYWHCFKNRLFDDQCFASKLATKRLILKMNAIKPDIILLHHIHGYYINMRILFNYLASNNVPVVWVFHDCWSFTGHCAYFDYVGCNKWKSLCQQCPQKKSYPRSFFIDHSKKNFIEKRLLFTSLKNLTIVPVSHWLGYLVKESFLKDYPVRVIHNGISITNFRPLPRKDSLIRKYDLCGKKVVLGVAGVWSKRKGLHDFILLSQIINSNYKILLVGLSGLQIAKLPQGIIGIKKTENVEQLAELYSMADVFVNPTYEDTFPTTNLEALACGTPVVAYRTGGNMESIDEQVGKIVDKGDIEGLNKAINDVIELGKDKFMRICREKAVRFYDKNAVFKKYLKLFEELIYCNQK